MGQCAAAMNRLDPVNCEARCNCGAQVVTINVLLYYCSKKLEHVCMHVLSNSLVCDRGNIKCPVRKSRL